MARATELPLTGTILIALALLHAVECVRLPTTILPDNAAHINNKIDNSIINHVPRDVFTKTGLESTSKLTPTIQVVVNPRITRSSPIHDEVYKSLALLRNTTRVRYVPWLPYPRLAVAELQQYEWNFTLIDPLMEDFFNAIDPKDTMINFSTIPEWMWACNDTVTGQRIRCNSSVPSDPNTPIWNYEQGTELFLPGDAGLKEVGDYYGRLVSWYTKGGFVDEKGTFHASKYRYNITWWEVLNEVDSEHKMSPELYTKIYDAVVTAIRAVVPDMQFCALALANPTANGENFLTYFLDAANHAPGIPIDMMSYHFYCTPGKTDPSTSWGPTCYQEADKFLDVVKRLEAIRLKLSPTTKVDLDELGVILSQDATSPPYAPIPPIYWNVAGSMYAYLCAELSYIGIDFAGESQLMGYPSQFPSVTLLDWNNGTGNARFWTVELLIAEGFTQGVQLLPAPDVGQGSTVTIVPFVTTDNVNKLLCINRGSSAQTVALPPFTTASIAIVDEESGYSPARHVQASASFPLKPYAVAIATFL